MRSSLTVLTAATSTDLTTLATAKEELDITTRKLDIKLKRWITDASADCLDYLNRTLALERVSETFFMDPGANNTGLLLSRRPVSLVESVTISPASTVLDITSWHVEPASGLLYRLDLAARRRMWNTAMVTVVYSGGYAKPADLPRPIERACLLLLRMRYASGDRDPTVKSEDIPGVLNTQYWVGGVGDNAAIPPEAAARLDPYREVSLA